MIETFGRTLVLAPHPDDETLGCGGTLVRLRQQAQPLFWVLMTRMSEAAGYGAPEIERRGAEIQRVAAAYGFTETVQMPFDAATLDAVHLNALIAQLARVFDRLQPETVLLPHPADAHSDHGRSFVAGSACAKWFRRPYLRRVMSYEVLSETRFNLDPSLVQFAPNAYVKLSEAQLERKVAIMGEYSNEMAAFPFPRSPEAIRHLAAMRGSECGAAAAEAFVLLREAF
jgi:N-acetylglucosamine malate deacetylase 1